VWKFATAVVIIWVWFGHSESVGQEPPNRVTVRSLMTADEFRVAGLHKLAPVELDSVDAWFARTALRIIAASRSRTEAGGNLTEDEVEAYFRRHTVAGNRAVAVKLRFSVPSPGTAYLLTVHGYPNNRQVCEELIAPYNADPSTTTIPGGRYYCETLTP
jgi:hypothetical protein